MLTDILDRVSLAVSAYRPEETLAVAAALQLVPENASTTIRLEALAHVAAALRDVRMGTTVDIKAVANILNGPPLSPSPITSAEDPSECPFVESFTFHGGGYLVFPGIVANQSYIVRHLSKAIFMDSGEWSNPAFPTLARQLFIAFLTISDAVASRARIHRHTISSEGQTQEVVVPSPERLAELTAAVTFTEREFRDLLNNRVPSMDFLKPFILQQGASALHNYSVENSPLHSQPLVRSGGRIIVASPGMLMSAIRNGVIQLAIFLGVVEELARRYNHAVWHSLVKVLSILGHKKMSVPPPNPQEHLWFRDAFFRFDRDKVLYLCLVTDSLEHYDFSDPFGRATPEDISDWVDRRLCEVESEMLALKDSPNELVLAVITQDVGRWQVMGFNRPAEPVRSPFITFSAADLEVISFFELCDPLVFWKYAKESDRVRKSIKISSATQFNEFAFYRECGYSYYVSDERQPNFMSLLPGYEGKLKQEFVRKLDRHGVDSFNDGGIVEVVSFYAAPSVPIYAPFDPPRERAAVLVEVMTHPIWVLGPTFGDSEESSADHRRLCIEWAETVAYWLWQLSRPILERGGRLRIGPKVLSIELDLGVLDHWGRPEARANTQLDQCVSVEMDASAARIRVALHPDFAKFLEGNNNDGERYLMEKILRGLATFIETKPEGQLSSEDVLQIIEQRMAPPLKKKLLFMETNMAPEMDARNLPAPCLVQRSEDPLQLDELGEYLRNEKSIPYGDIKERHAREAVLNQVVEFFFGKLEALVACVSPIGLLEWLVSHHEALVNSTARLEMTTPTRLACFSEDEDSVKEMREDYQANSRAALATRFLVEYVIAKPPRGLRPISLSLFDRALNLAMLITDFGFMSDVLHYELADIRLSILPSGRLGHDKDQYSVAYEAYKPFFFEGRVSQLTSSFMSHWTKDVSSSKKSSEIERIDQAFQSETCGHTLTDFMELFGEVLNMGLPDGRPFVSISMESFKDHLATRLGWTKQKASDIINILSLKARSEFLKPENPFTCSDVYPWVFNRSLSYLHRPLLQIVGPRGIEVLCGFRHINKASHYLVGLCMDGRFHARSQVLRQLMGGFNHAKGEAFNDAVADVVSQIEGAIVHRRVDKIKNAGKVLPVPGDIDVLVYLPGVRQLVILECKDVARARTPRELRRELEELYRDGRHRRAVVSKMRERENFIRGHLSAVMVWLGVGSGVSPEVRSILVVDKELMGPFMSSSPVQVVPYRLIRDTLAGLCVSSGPICR